MPTDHLKVLVVAGARPNFMKVAPILRALTAAGHDAVLVHTGQHYDSAMSDTFFQELGIREPDFHLGVGTGSHAVQTARIMEAFEPVLAKVHPHWVVVVGDVNSTMAASIVAAKMRTKTHNRIAHVEGGLRSRDWAMPEEVNRVVTDAVADLLLTPSHDATENLEREGIPREKIRFVGNVMIDTLLTQLPTARATNTLERLGLRRKNYVAATLHRPSNVDDPQTLGAILDGFALIAENVPVVLPLHPRTRKSIERHHLHARLAPLMIHEPFGYTEMLALTDGAQCVMTDSGGLQEETTALGVPCVTLREQTERPITITEGTNRLVHWPITGRGMLGAYVDAVAAGHTGEVKRPDGWDGHAAERVVEALVAAS